MTRARDINFLDDFRTHIRCAPSRHRVHRRPPSACPTRRWRVTTAPETARQHDPGRHTNALSAEIVLHAIHNCTHFSTRPVDTALRPAMGLEEQHSPPYARLPVPTPGRDASTAEVVSALTRPSEAFRRPTGAQRSDRAASFERHPISLDGRRAAGCEGVDSVYPQIHRFSTGEPYGSGQLDQRACTWRSLLGVTFDVNPEQH